MLNRKGRGRDIEHKGSLERTKEASNSVLPLECSPNFPPAQYLDIRTLTHELIVNYNLAGRVFA